MEFCRAVGLTLLLFPGMFQALGNALKPAFALKRQCRLLTYVVPAVWLAGQPWVSLRDFWYLIAGLRSRCRP